LVEALANNVKDEAFCVTANLNPLSRQWRGYSTGINF